MNTQPDVAQQVTQRVEGPVTRSLSWKPSSSWGGHLYVLQAPNGQIKVGRARDVRRRIDNLSTSHAHDLALIAIVYEGGHLEKDLHRELRYERIRSEWFAGTEVTKQTIAQFIGVHIAPSCWPYAYLMSESEASRQRATELLLSRLKAKK